MKILKDDDGGIDNIAATIIDETPENSMTQCNTGKDDEAKEAEDEFDENSSLSREMTKLSFFSATNESAEYKRKLVQMIKPNTLLFSEEDTTYKPPRRKQQQEKGKSGKTGKFFFGKTLKSVTSPEKEKEPIRCVILDVGGERFTAQRNALLKYPTTRLGKLMRSSTITGRSPDGYRLKNIFRKGILSLCDEFVPGDPAEYFFDKNPENFAAILEMHRR